MAGSRRIRRLHRQYLAAADPYRFPGALAALLGMDLEDLRTLYDQPAPDPEGPAFAGEVRAVAALARRNPAAPGGAACASGPPRRGRPAPDRCVTIIGTVRHEVAPVAVRRKGPYLGLGSRRDESGAIR